MDFTTILITVVMTIVIVWCVKTYNSLDRTYLNILELDSRLKLSYQRRSILVHEFMNLVKPHLHSDDVSILTNVEKAYGDKTHPAISKAGSESSKEDISTHSLEIQSRTLERLLIIAQQYPGLQTDREYLYVVQKLQDAQTLITNTRISLNESTKAYNKEIRSFPDVIIAKSCGFPERVVIKLEEDEKYPLNINN